MSAAVVAQVENQLLDTGLPERGEGIEQGIVVIEIEGIVAEISDPPAALRRQHGALPDRIVLIGLEVIGDLARGLIRGSGQREGHIPFRGNDSSVHLVNLRSAERFAVDLLDVVAAPQARLSGRREGRHAADLEQTVGPCLVAVHVVEHHEACILGRFPPAARRGCGILRFDLVAFDHGVERQPRAVFPVSVVVVDIVLRGNVQEDPLQKRLVIERIIGCHLLHGIVPQVILLHVVEHPLLELLFASECDLRFVIVVRSLLVGIRIGASRTGQQHQQQRSPEELFQQVVFHHFAVCFVGLSSAVRLFSAEACHRHHAAMPHSVHFGARAVQT